MNQNQISNPLSNSQLKSIHELVDEVGKRQLQDFGQINSDIKPCDIKVNEENPQKPEKTNSLAESNLIPLCQL